MCKSCHELDYVRNNSQIAYDTRNSHLRKVPNDIGAKKVVDLAKNCKKMERRIDIL